MARVRIDPTTRMPLPGAKAALDDLEPLDPHGPAARSTSARTPSPPFAASSTRASSP